MSTTEARQRATVGHVGCPKSEIRIGGGDDNSWTAQCRGVTYYCAIDNATTGEMLLAGDNNGHTQQVTCARADSATASAAGAH
jgi:hypothetical protein